MPMDVCIGFYRVMPKVTAKSFVVNNLLIVLLGFCKMATFLMVKLFVIIVTRLRAVMLHICMWGLTKTTLVTEWREDVAMPQKAKSTAAKQNLIVFLAVRVMVDTLNPKKRHAETATAAKQSLIPFLKESAMGVLF